VIGIVSVLVPVILGFLPGLPVPSPSSPRRGPSLTRTPSKMRKAPAIVMTGAFVRHFTGVDDGIRTRDP
jgi:hypothetical protein